MAFVVASRARSFVVHHQFYTFRMSVFVKRFEVEVGIRGYKIEHIVFFVTKPIFPTYIPTFYKHLVEAVFSCKIDIFAHFFVVSTVGTIRFSFAVINGIEVDSREVVRITPRVFTGDHFPPNTYVFYRFNPRSIGDSTRLIEIENQSRS